MISSGQLLSSRVVDSREAIPSQMKGKAPFDIFESVFGGGRRAPRKPIYGLEVSFMDAVKGGAKTVEINGKEKTIKIPAGADDGTQIRFTDFDIRLSVRPDSNGYQSR